MPNELAKFTIKVFDNYYFVNEIQTEIFQVDLKVYNDDPKSFAHTGLVKRNQNTQNLYFEEPTDIDLRDRPVIIGKISELYSEFLECQRS